MSDRDCKLLKACTDSSTSTVAAVDADNKHPRKKIHFVTDERFNVIDETIAKTLDINELNDAWFEEILTQDGNILIRRYNYNISKQLAGEQPPSIENRCIRMTTQIQNYRRHSVYNDQEDYRV